MALRSAASACAASITASVVITTSIVASPGASIPAPFAMPPIDQPPRETTDRFGVESVVMMARDAASPAVGAELGDALLGAVEHLRPEHLVAGADEARRADQHVARADAEQLGGSSRRSGASSGTRKSP